MHAPLRTLDIVGPLDRTGGLPRAALIAVSLQEFAYQLLAQSVQHPFDVALTHLLGFARREVGFGLSEGGLGRRIRHLVGGSDGSHRSTLPQPPVRIPDHRMDQDRLGRLTGTAAAPVHATSTAGGAQRDPEGPSRKPRRRHGHRRLLPSHEPYQNAARMFRGARRRGQTERPGAVIRPGWLPETRRVGALSGRCPPQGAPKRDRPRAKTPRSCRGGCRWADAASGLGDWRPAESGIFGRFDVEEVIELTAGAAAAGVPAGARARPRQGHVAGTAWRGVLPLACFFCTNLVGTLVPTVPVVQIPRPGPAVNHSGRQPCRHEPPPRGRVSAATPSTRRTPHGRPLRCDSPSLIGLAGQERRWGRDGRWAVAPAGGGRRVHHL